VVVGPWTSGRPIDDVRSELLALADAGCRWIEVHEPASTGIGSGVAGGSDDRSRFAEAHRALTEGLGSDVHLSLAIVGGNADAAGIDTILAGTYASLALDLIGGPDNWRLAVAAPTNVGIVCGVVSALDGSDDGPEILLWAADYAASSRGRGMDRVGLATAGSLAAMTWDVAATKVRRLGEAARLVTASPEERRAAIDPRAIDIRSAALGHASPQEPDAGAASDT
jgi:methionine synthase II (cobalamin-independent)